MTADPLFYQVFQNLPELFLELVGEPLKSKSAYEYSAPDIKQTALRLDGLLKTKSGYSFKPIYFIEAQGYKDEKKNFARHFLPKSSFI